jgi:hypothetical protein
MFGYTYRGVKIDSRWCKIDYDMFGCFRIELILSLEFILKLGFVALDSRLDVYIQIYSSTHFYINIIQTQIILYSTRF